MQVYVPKGWIPWDIDLRQRAVEERFSERAFGSHLWQNESGKNGQKEKEIIVSETVKNTRHTTHLTLLTKNNSAQLGVFIYKEFQYKVNTVDEFPSFPWRGHVQGSLAMQDGKAWPVPTC